MVSRESVLGRLLALIENGATINSVEIMERKTNFIYLTRAIKFYGNQK